MARAKREKIPLGTKEVGSLGSLGDLFSARGFSTPQKSDPEPEPEAPLLSASIEDLKEALSGQSKLRIVSETKGRKGRTVTLVVGLSVSPEWIAIIAGQMRKSLGCGATVEEGAILLQGDMVKRATDWLRGRGAPL